MKRVACQGMAVIPVHNEARTIAAIVRAARAYLPVLVVDDASDDDSGREAAVAGATVLTLAKRGGKGGALRAGFAVARQRRVGAIITLDGDGQHDPADIPRFLHAHRCWPHTVIIGGRLSAAAAIPRGRLYAIQVSSFWINWLSSCELRDTQSGFRLYPAALLRQLRLRHGGFLLESEILIKAGQAGWHVREIPIRAVYPPGRRSQYRPLRDGIPITAYLLYRGCRFWPQQLRLLYASPHSGNAAAVRRMRQRTRRAALATLCLPLLGVCVLAYLLGRRLGVNLLAWYIRQFYQPFGRRVGMG